MRIAQDHSPITRIPLYCNAAAKLIQLGYFCSAIATQYYSLPPQCLTIFLFKTISLDPPVEPPSNIGRLL